MKGKKLAESRLTWNYRIPWWPCGAWAARVGRCRGSRAAAAWCEPPGSSARSPSGRRWRGGTWCPWAPGHAGPCRATVASTTPTPASRPPATTAPPPRKPRPTAGTPVAAAELELPSASWSERWASSAKQAGQGMMADCERPTTLVQLQYTPSSPSS